MPRKSKAEKSILITELSVTDGGYKKCPTLQITRCFQRYGARNPESGQKNSSEVPTMYEDKILVCKGCEKEFTFTAGEQEFYAEKGFQNEPQRCKACRDARKNATREPREMFTTVCHKCGKEAKVPFQPGSDRPVYCSDCFAEMKGQQ